MKRKAKLHASISLDSQLRFLQNENRVLKARLTANAEKHANEIEKLHAQMDDIAASQNKLQEENNILNDRLDEKETQNTQELPLDFEYTLIPEIIRLRKQVDQLFVEALDLETERDILQVKYKALKRTVRGVATDGASKLLNLLRDPPTDQCRGATDKYADPSVKTCSRL